MLFSYGIFTFLWRQLRIPVLKILCRDEIYLIWKLSLNISVEPVDIVAQVFERVVNYCDCFFEIFFGSLLFSYNLFPVPLVHIYGMKIVKLFVTSDGVHIGVDTVSRSNTVSAESHTLPFGKGLYYFNSLFVHIFDCKLYGSLNSVEVVVKSAFGSYKQRRRNTSE